MSVEVLVIAQVLLDDVPAGGREQLRLLERFKLFVGQLKTHGGVLVVEALQADGIVGGVIDRHAIQGERCKFMALPVIDSVDAPVDLIVLSLAVQFSGA